jgi:hypothetical protein
MENCSNNLKRKTAGCMTKKSKILSHLDVTRFLNQADDDTYLLLKVIIKIYVELL